jgi:hypothetical protein
MPPRETLKPVDVLRHELKALRFILDAFHSGKLEPGALPPRDDFQSAEARAIYDAIVGTKSRADAERRINGLELEEVDVESFLRLAGDHYYAYPALVRERARAIRAGRLKVEGA